MFASSKANRGNHDGGNHDARCRSAALVSRFRSLWLTTSLVHHGLRPGKVPRPNYRFLRYAMCQEYGSSRDRPHMLACDLPTWPGHILIQWRRWLNRQEVTTFPRIKDLTRRHHNAKPVRDDTYHAQQKMRLGDWCGSGLRRSVCAYIQTLYGIEDELYFG